MLKFNYDIISQKKINYDNMILSTNIKVNCYEKRKFTPLPLPPKFFFDSINYILKLFLGIYIYILTTFRKIYTPMFTILFLIFAKKNLFTNLIFQDKIR